MVQHVGVASEAASRPSEGEQQAPEGLSPFLGRVLNQLSLTSWLPSIMLVGVSALLIRLHSQGDTDISAAISGLTSKALGTIVVLLVGVVLAAVVTQAFSFGAIRFPGGLLERQGTDQTNCAVADPRLATSPATVGRACPLRSPGRL